MSELTDTHIKLGYFNGDSQYFYIRANEGYLNAHFTVPDRRYEINYYELNGDEDRLGKGYGKDLLRVAKEHARTIGAKSITASRIISGESFGAIRSVFGKENVTLESGCTVSGDFVTNITNATLSYAFNETDPTLREGVSVGRQYRSQGARELAKKIDWFNADITLLSTQVHAVDGKMRGNLLSVGEDEYFSYLDIKEFREILLGNRDTLQDRIDGIEF